MNELIKVNYNDERQTTSARSLWEFLDRPYEQFNKWFDAYKDYGFTENQDYQALSIKILTVQGNSVDAKDYEVSIDMAKELAMLQKTEKGKQARQYFLELERQWNSPEALFARALKMADRKINSLETEKIELKTIIQKQSPKVLFANSVMASSTSILVADLAKIIAKNGVDIGELRLWQWLRNNGYAIKEKGRSYNMPTQKSTDLKVMTVKEGTNIDAAGESHIHTTTLVTGKGQVYFVNKFLAAKKSAVLAEVVQ
jgi:anti-repressor protein